MPSSFLNDCTVCDQRDLAAIAGQFHAGALERCFPEAMRLPVLGSTSLQTLEGDLTQKISAKASSQNNTTAAPVSAELKLTLNRGVTYSSSGAARTDLFFRFKSENSENQASKDELGQLLQEVCCATVLLLLIASVCTQPLIVKAGLEAV